MGHMLYEARPNGHMKDRIMETERDCDLLQLPDDLRRQTMTIAID